MSSQQKNQTINVPHESHFCMPGITCRSSGKHFEESDIPLPCHPSTRELGGTCQAACLWAMSSERLPVACVELDMEKRQNQWQQGERYSRDTVPDCPLVTLIHPALLVSLCLTWAEKYCHKLLQALFSTIKATHL